MGSSSLFFEKALPECDLRYFSKFNAVILSSNAQYQINFHGMYLDVWVDFPAL